MGKKSRKAGKAERRQAAAAPAKRTVEFRVKNEMPDYDPDEIYSYAQTIAIDDDQERPRVIKADQEWSRVIDVISNDQE